MLQRESSMQPSTTTGVGSTVQSAGGGDAVACMPVTWKLSTGGHVHAAGCCGSQQVRGSPSTELQVTHSMLQAAATYCQEDSGGLWWFSRMLHVLPEQQRSSWPHIQPFGKAPGLHERLHEAKRNHPDCCREGLAPPEHLHYVRTVAASIPYATVQAQPGKPTLGWPKVQDLLLQPLAGPLERRPCPGAAPAQAGVADLAAGQLAAQAATEHAPQPEGKARQQPAVGWQAPAADVAAGKALLCCHAAGAGATLKAVGPAGCRCQTDGSGDHHGVCLRHAWLHRR